MNEDPREQFFKTTGLPVRLTHLQIVALYSSQPPITQSQIPPTSPIGALKIMDSFSTGTFVKGFYNGACKNKAIIAK